MGLIPEEQAAYVLDCEVNQRGLPIDMVLVDNAVRCLDRTRRQLLSEIEHITGVKNGNSVPQLAAWIDAQGVIATCLDKQAVTELLSDELLPDNVRQVLELRQQAALTSPNKYKTMQQMVDADGRLRNSFVFYGARTGRWTSRGAQFHNLPRGHLAGDDLTEVVDRIRAGGDATMLELQTCVRAAVRAPEGSRLVCADLANIEPRVLGWISEDPTLLGVFERDEDIYKDYGTALLKKDYNDITKQERTYCKAPSLGCGYGMGARGLVTYAEGYGVTMREEEAKVAVGAYRDRYEEVPVLWDALDLAARKLILNREGRIEVGRLALEYDKPWLFMVLPSGRKLAYLHPSIRNRPAPWDDTKTISSVHYMGVDQITKRWSLQTTHGGKWVEQACQAIARDVLAHGMLRAEAAGFEVLGTVHDECIALVPEDCGVSHPDLSQCMADPPPWADDQLHLAAEGFEDAYYHK